MPKPVALPIAPAAADPAQEVITLLRQIAADLHTLATPRPAGIAADDAALCGLLRAIDAAVGDRVFSAADLLIHARLPLATALQAAIIATVGAANARMVGKALARAEGRDLGGLVVIRVDSDSTGILWSVRRV